jgi:hypothetical protein
MGHCVGEKAIGGPTAIFTLQGLLMGHCEDEKAVYGPLSCFFFIGCANGPLCSDQGVASKNGNHSFQT